MELYRKYLRNKNEKKLFTHMFSIAICITLLVLMLLFRLEYHPIYDVNNTSSLQDDFKERTYSWT